MTQENIQVEKSDSGSESEKEEKEEKEHNSKFLTEKDIRLHWSVNIAGKLQIKVWDVHLKRYRGRTFPQYFSITEPEVIQLIREWSGVSDWNPSKKLQEEVQADLDKIEKLEKMNEDMLPSQVYTEIKSLKYDLGIKPCQENRGDTILLLGQSQKSGKTSLMWKLYKEIWENTNTVPILLCHNYESPLAQDDDICVIDWIPDELLTILKNIQKRSENKYHFVIFIDDYMKQSQRNIMETLLICRNINISTVIATQYARIIPKAARGNVKYIFMGKYSQNEPIKDLIEIYLGQGMIGKGLIKQISNYKAFTSNYRFLVIDPLERIRLYRNYIAS